MSSKLVIVESPTKAKKLNSFLGKDYLVEASVGHVRDLPKNKIGVDIDHDFQPIYQVDPEKKSTLSKLKKLAKKSTEVILATDPDREGEAIAWHLSDLLNKDTKKFSRAVFFEITKQAVLDAIAQPGEINLNLVNAQQARRILDRLVGYEASPVLWKKVRRGLSAGRVQSVALRLIAEREREIEAFKPDEYWEIDVDLLTGKASLTARVIKLNGEKFEPKSESDVKPILAVLPKADYQVVAVNKKQKKRASLPPLTTSTLQQVAASQLGMSSSQTMRLAQHLYEEGLITYHRTDSLSLSKQSVQAARAFIVKSYGDRYLPEKPRFFKTTSKSAQEAHEAIRVTDVNLSSDRVTALSSKLTTRHAKLYDLIWRRFVASQMTYSLSDQTTIEISAKPVSSNKDVRSLQLRSSGSVVVFDGWTKLFKTSDSTILPSVEDGEKLNYQQHRAEQKFTLPPARYNDASLVKELEKRGIGRPSTYASIISVIIKRGYVERRQKRFFITPVGLTVSDFLLKHFPEFMEYEFTAEMEANLDRIAEGKKKWQKVVASFYKPFHQRIEKVTKNADRIQIPVEKTGEPCPLCGDGGKDGQQERGEVVIRSGRYGKFYSCSRFPDCKYVKNFVETVEGVKCPLCGEGDVVIKKSRWGRQFYGCSRYPECNWGSPRKPKPGDKVTKAKWAEIQQEIAERKAKRKANQVAKKSKKSGKKASKKKTGKKK